MNLLRQFTIVRVKKHISILTALLILVSNSGLAFSVHYCGGKIASVSSIFSEVQGCEMASVEEPLCGKTEVTHKSCCSDKHVNFKSKTEKIIIKTISLDFEPAFFSEYKYHTLATVKALQFSNFTEAFYCDSNAPPLYKLYCQYTFYS